MHKKIFFSKAPKTDLPWEFINALYSSLEWQLVIVGLFCQTGNDIANRG